MSYSCRTTSSASSFLSVASSSYHSSYSLSSNNNEGSLFDEILQSDIKHRIPIDPFDPAIDRSLPPLHPKKKINMDDDMSIDDVFNDRIITKTPVKSKSYPTKLTNERGDKGKKSPGTTIQSKQRNNQQNSPIKSNEILPPSLMEIEPLNKSSKSSSRSLRYPFSSSSALPPQNNQPPNNKNNNHTNNNNNNNNHNNNSSHPAFGRSHSAPSISHNKAPILSSINRHHLQPSPSSSPSISPIPSPSSSPSLLPCPSPAACEPLIDDSSLPVRSNSELRDARIKLLSKKSHSALILDCLLGRRSNDLDALEQAFIKKLSKKQDTEGKDGSSPLITPSVGFNAATRSESRRDDHFIGEVGVLQENLVAYFLHNGANPNYCDADGNTPLGLLVQMKNSARLVKLLLKFGGDAQYANSKRRKTSGEIKRNEESGEMELIKEKSKSRIRDDADCDEGSLVDLAMQCGNDKIVRLLLCSGSLPTKAALEANAQHQKLLVFSRLYGFESDAIKVLNDALIKSIIDGDEETAINVLAHGAQVNYRDSNGRTPLYLAIENRNPSLAIIKELLKAGANPNDTDCTQSPMAIYLLVRHDSLSLQLFDLLIEYKLNIHAKVDGEDGLSLEEFAEQNGASASIIQKIKTVKREASIFGKAKYRLAGLSSAENSPAISPSSSPMCSAVTDSSDMEIFTPPHSPTAKYGKRYRHRRQETDQGKVASPIKKGKWDSDDE